MRKYLSNVRSIAPAALELMAAPSLKAALLIVSDTATRDPSTDRCTDALKTVFNDSELNTKWDVTDRKFVSDDVLSIQQALTSWTDRKTADDPVNVIVCSGGTGFARRDVTPEVSTVA